MTIFLLFALGLITIALLIVLPTLLKHNVALPAVDANQTNITVFRQQLLELEEDRVAGLLSQEHYEPAKRDLERLLAANLHDTVVVAPKSGLWLVPVLAVTIPILASILYLQVGNYQLIAPTTTALASNSPVMPKMSMENLVDRLAERMQAEPNNLQGWLMLGRSALALGQAQRAIDAYAKAADLAPNEPEVLLTYADVLAQTTNKYAGKSAELISTALSINPEHPLALWLMGWVELERGAVDKAVAHWVHLETKIPPESEEAQSLHKLIISTKEKTAPANGPTLP